MPNLDPTAAAAVSEIVTSQLMGKKWYLSKTFWTNVVATLTLSLQIKYGFILGPEYQAVALSLLNIGLRKLTNEPIIW
jgi:hypothetical protein